MGRRKYQFADRAEAEAEYKRADWNHRGAEMALAQLLANPDAIDWLEESDRETGDSYRAFVVQPGRADGSGGFVILQWRGVGTGNTVSVQPTMDWVDYYLGHGFSSNHALWRLAVAVREHVRAARGW